MRSSKSSVVGIGVSLAAVLALTGCDQAPNTSRNDTSDNSTAAENRVDTMKDSLEEKANNAENSVSDAVITTKVKTAILNDADLKVFEIHVDTVDGVVTLTGTVDSPEKIDHARMVVSSVEGVMQGHGRSPARRHRRARCARPAAVVAMSPQPGPHRGSARSRAAFHRRRGTGTSGFECCPAAQPSRCGQCQQSTTAVPPCGCPQSNALV